MIGRYYQNTCSSTNLVFFSTHSPAVCSSQLFGVNSIALEEVGARTIMKREIVKRSKVRRVVVIMIVVVVTVMDGPLLVGVKKKFDLFVVVVFVVRRPGHLRNTCHICDSFCDLLSLSLHIIIFGVGFMLFKVHSWYRAG